MKLNRKKYQEIRKYDHGQMDSFVESVKKTERERIIRVYQEALENVPGIGQKRREEVQNKVNEILKKGD
ncbi:MAG: hypothetical protein Q4A29_03925 [Eubacteriales bacterium]|nr:hypothetical protein [Eubacteriales bacterium]